MATEGTYVWDANYKAGGDYSSTGQFCPVAFSAADTVVVCSAATDCAIGILQNKPKSGEVAVVRMLGRSKAIVDGNSPHVVAGDLLGSSSGGHLVKKATGDYAVIAQAVQASSANGTIVAVNLLMAGMVFRSPLG